jgi:PglZ domain
MTSWRDRILSEFLPDAHSWVIVTDLDRLFDDAELQKNLTTRGYELIFYDGDSIALRHHYETSHRLKAANMGTILIVRGDANTARRLPYDLLSSATLLSFGLSDLFPYLNDPIIAQCFGLDLTHMDAIFAAAQASPQMLGATATKDFLLRSIFALDAQAIQNDIDLLRSMLQLHHRELLLPSVLLDRFVEILKTNPQLAKWDLKTIISDRPAFLNWFQAQWQLFAQEKVRELRSAKSYKTESPALPLDNPDLRFYIEELFRVGLLEPISAQNLSIRVNELEGQWIGTGIAIDPETVRVASLKENRQIDLQAAIAKIETCLLKFDTQPPSHQDWFALTPIWAQAIVHWHATKDRSAWQSRWNTLQQQLDSTFQSWLQTNYDGLYNYPVGDSPIMLHHIPKFLARRRSTNLIALIVLDGMAFDQWLVLRDVLAEQMGTSFSPTERATLAMLPTLTSISRQAIFAGKLPSSFADSLGTTAKEAKHWETFWCNNDSSLVRENIAYLNIVGDLADLEKVRLVLSHPRQKVLGLVVDKIDNIMHGMTLGTPGMHAQVNQWAQQGFMKSLLELLRDRNYDIYLTADHGNLEATGIGQPSERAFADIRGERVRIYSNATLREATQAKFPTAIGWTPKILPADSIPLFAPDRTAFVRSGEQLVCHGGISIEEVIVPFISIK